MSGHSKWANIKHRKGAVDSKRASLFTKLSKNITIAARDGGGDPEFNFRLRTTVDAALEANMPKDKVDKAIKRGTGEIEGGVIEEILYEGFGPGGAAVLVESVTDCRNRTSANFKYVFTKHGGSLGGSGSVQWMFSHKGTIRASGKSHLLDDDQMSLIDAGADDIANEDGTHVIICSPESLAAVRSASLDAGLKIEDLGLEWFAKESVPASDAVRGQLVALLEALDDDEDVANIYTNVSL